ncbi:hypothetical protein FACS1894132_04780 [Clostridia bacterium]|nr:hypothetical protein FACS1894132_04780 [Clostridia bacterium]
MNGKLIKVLGITATIIGGAATLLSNWVADKNMDEKIEQKVNEALNKKES